MDDRFAELRKQMRNRIDQLPQRSVLQEHVIDAWIQGVVTLEPARALWHVERLRGFGGSEAGELLRYRNGEPFYFQSPEDIIASKLLLKLPDQGNIHTARGSDLEVVVQRAFLQHTGMQSILHSPKIQDAFQRPRSDLACVVGNPDEVVQDSANRVFIPDFKVRSSLDWESDIEFNYVAQCHWYAGLLEANAGVVSDGLMLAELDIPDATADGMRDAIKFLQGKERECAIERFASVINEMGLPGFGLRVTEFEYSKKLLSDLDDIASTLWEENVLKGHPLVRGQDRRPPLPDEAASQLKAIEGEFLKYKMIRDVAEDRDKEISAQAQCILREHDAEAWEGDAISVKFGYTKKFNAEKAAHSLIADGMNKSELVKSVSLDSVRGTDLDAEQAVVVLRNNGLLNESVLKPNWNPTAIKQALKRNERLNEGMFTTLQPRAALGQSNDDKAFRAALTGRVGQELDSINILDDGSPQHSSEDDAPEASQPSLA